MYYKMPNSDGSLYISMSIYQVHVPKLEKAFTNIKIEDKVKEISSHLQLNLPIKAYYALCSYLIFVIQNEESRVTFKIKKLILRGLKS